MGTFFMFGNYTAEALKSMSVERTELVKKEIKKFKGEVSAMHALLGQYDLLFCVKLPGIEEAMKASVNISRMTGISFVTYPAIPVETFDQLTAKL
jgi:uncharacterized protein with GYD domain